MTRTHTVYFDEDSLVPIRDAFIALEGDWLDRGPHMSREAHEAGLRRLMVLSAAINLLAEPVPEAFG